MCCKLTHTHTYTYTRNHCSIIMVDITFSQMGWYWTEFILCWVTYKFCIFYCIVYPARKVFRKLFQRFGSFTRAFIRNQVLVDDYSLYMWTMTGRRNEKLSNKKKGKESCHTAQRSSCRYQEKIDEGECEKMPKATVTLPYVKGMS